MQVKVTRTRLGSPDGSAVRRYEAGCLYDMPDALAAVFVREGWAVPVTLPDHPATDHPARSASNKVKRPMSTK